MKATTKPIGDQITFKDPTAPGGKVTHKPAGVETNKDKPAALRATEQELGKLASRFSK